MALRQVILTAAALAPLPVWAADMPKQGTDGHTTTYQTKQSQISAGDDQGASLSEVKGIAQNDRGGPMFNVMGARCPGMTGIAGDARNGRGTCVDIDKGNKLSAFQSRGVVDTHTLVAGTGKDKALSGTANYSFEALKRPDGSSIAIAPHKP